MPHAHPMIARLFIFAAFFAMALMPSWPEEAMSQEMEAQVDLDYELRRANRLLEMNGITRSITHFERVLRHDPTYHEDVPFVLAQVYEFKEEWSRVAALYTMYLIIGTDDARRREATEALKRLRTPEWQTVTLSIPNREDLTGLEVRMFDHYIVACGPDAPTEWTLPPGDYPISVHAVDHKVHRETLHVAQGPVASKAKLVKRVFYGGLLVTTEATPEVEITIIQEEADAPDGVIDEAPIMQGSMDEEITLPTGTYMLELRAPDKDLWIRRVTIDRTLVTEVRAGMVEALPPEIRTTQGYESAQRHHTKRRATDAARRRIHGASIAGSVRAQTPLVRVGGYIHPDDAKNN